MGVLGDVGQRLGDDEIGGRLDRWREALRQLRVDGHRHRRARDQRVQRRLEPAVGEDGGMDPARELAQLVQAGGELARGLLQQRHQLRVGRAIARQPQQQRQPDEPRLRPVVQVALELPPRGVAGRHHPRPRLPQLLQALAQLVGEMHDVAAQQPAEERERRHEGRHERDPPRGVADPGPRDRDRQERQQREDVHRRQLQPLELAGPAPAPHRPHEHDGEQDEVHGRAERRQHVRQVRIVADEDQALRALVAAELMRCGEHQRGHEREREEDVARERERAVQRLGQPPGREAQPEVQEDAAPQPAEDGGDRVDERHVGRVQREQEPREAEQHHQRADPVLWPLVRRVQAGRHEAPPDRGREHGPHHRRAVMVAGQLDRRHDDTARQRGDRDRQPPHGLKYASGHRGSGPAGCARA
jgi:hypothetical protein